MTDVAVAPIFELRECSRAFKTGGEVISAVDDVDLAIAVGEFVAIEGRSGSGKSTILQLLGALDRPTGGTVTFEGVELSSLKERDRTRLRSEAFGFVFQSFNLIPTLSAAENVEAAMVPLVKKAKRRRQRVSDVLAEVGLENRKNHLPSRLSGGEQQRVAIARALANEPRVVLADEPTGNLDSETSEEIMNTLTRLSADHGVTLILVTHAEEVASRATRRVAMRDGRLVRPTEATTAD